MVIPDSHEELSAHQAVGLLSEGMGTIEFSTGMLAMACWRNRPLLR
jgi:hypothetical protein